MSYADQLRDLQDQQILPGGGEEGAFNKLLGYNIATARSKKGWAQRHLADLMDMTQSTWCRKEQGETALTAYELTRCAKVLNRRIQDLIPS